jgi:DNA-binding NarL/FixJ family response regulator
VSGTFRLLIDLSEDFEVVGVAANGREVVDLARATHPDVVVMDIRMPVLDGLAATAEITADEALRSPKVLVLTTFETDEYVAEAIRAGASGFLGKGTGPEELLAGIRTVADGDALLSAAATRALISRFLTPPGPSAPLLSRRTRSPNSPHENGRWSPRSRAACPTTRSRSSST